uniref:Eukaryotic translation initiation factor 3 subunit L n=1 Tax=Prasinoderma coloniale TaxID=156133 RepID=A0A7R9TYX1_9VIRI|eukprot:PRCOL_00004532-RA
MVEEVHDIVKQFVVYFYRHIRERNVYEIHSMYESSFAKLTDRFFKDKPWPPVEVIAPLVDDDHVFCLLYKEMYYRHLYARLQPTLEQRCESWDNYCALFQVILNTNINMQLPNLWLWDMVDDFVYQFQSFCAYRSKLKLKSPKEIAVLREADQVWNALGVLNYLQALVDKSDIVSVLKGEREGGDRSFTETDGYGYGKGSNVLKALGYFSLIGLLRVHCLLGDYHSALRSAEALGASEGRAGAALYQRVTGCHISVFYYSGFCHLMKREYTLAARAFNSILLYISRTKQFHTQTAAYDQIIKRNEEMHALLAICSALCPQERAIDEGVHKAVLEKHGDKLQRMSAGQQGGFNELFTYACPKFVTPVPPNYDDTSADTSQDAYKLQLSIFMEEVRQQARLPKLRSYLRLYTTIPVAKLASFMEVTESELMALLMAFKHKLGGGEGENEGLHFYVEDKVIHVSDAKVEKKHGDFFASNIVRLHELTKELSV